MLTSCALENFCGVYEKRKSFPDGHAVLLGDQPSVKLYIYKLGVQQQPKEY